jgi:hypothetical protein
MGKSMKGRVLTFIVVLIFTSILICGCLSDGEKVITTPANEMILTEADFDNNWTSWWTSMELETQYEPPIIDHSFVELRHYTSYPIDERDQDLKVWVIISVFNSTADADEVMNNRSEFFAQGYDLIDIDIGDEGFQYQHNDVTYSFFRVKNVLVTICFFPGFDGEKPDESRIVGLLELQESKIQ